MSTSQMICKHCHHEFKREAAFEAHVCDRMRRDEAAKTTTGQAAFHLYAAWQEELKRPTATPTLFQMSKFFITFLKFAQHIKRTRLPQPATFVRWAAQNAFPPVMWTYNEIYMRYVDYLDNHGDPIEFAERTVRNILNYCEQNDVPTDRFFELVPPGELTHMVQSRAVSPLFLFYCPGFRKKLKKGCTVEQFHIIETTMRPDKLADYIDTNPEIVDRVIEIVEASGLSE